jgi:hypothetical protein
MQINTFFLVPHQSPLSFLAKTGVTSSIRIACSENIIIITIHNCKEQDFEICAIQLVTKTSHLIILSLYRAPSGEVNEFLRRPDATLKYLYNPKSEFTICGDINYINESSQKETSKL